MYVHLRHVLQECGYLLSSCSLRAESESEERLIGISLAIGLSGINKEWLYNVSPLTALPYLFFVILETSTCQ